MKENAPQEEAGVRTRKAILQQLKQEGPTDSTALASRLGVSAMAIRHHLYELQRLRFVSHEEESRPMGRPAKVWRLTPAADRFFPDAHAELTVSLLNTVKDTFGEKGLDQLVSARARQQVESYQQRVPKGDSLHRRLKTLARIRSDEGYMAEVQRQQDGSFLLIENHCPICAAASTCMGLCSAELQVFQTVLGRDTRVERTEHKLAGSRRCVYKVTN